MSAPSTEVRITTDDRLIKIAVNSLDLLILREQLKQTESNLPSSFFRQRQLEQWICVRNLLLEQT